MIFIGMLMLRGELILNLRTMFPTALDANVSRLTSFFNAFCLVTCLIHSPNPCCISNVQPSPIESPQGLTPIVLANIEATPPTTPAKQQKKKQPPTELPKIALLFLTRGPMPLEPIWREFLHVDPNYLPTKNGKATWQKYFSMYVHTNPGFKYPRTSLFAPFTIAKPIAAKWGDHSIIDAERKLLTTALQDPLNSFFILLSETHVPLYSYPTTYLQLITSPHSRIHACGNSSAEDEDRRMVYRMAYEMKLVNSGISEDTWRKSSQWFGLIRSHAQLVTKDTIVDAAFRQYCYILPDPKNKEEYIRFCVSDEHYIPTMLAINKKESEIDCQGHITRVIWTGHYMHPKSFGKAQATMDTLRHELRGEHECRPGRVLERVADLVLTKIENIMEGTEDVFVDVDDEFDEIETEEEEIDQMSGLELIKYAMESEKAVVMEPHCPLYARKIVKEAEPEWRDLLKTVLQPTV